MIWFDSTKNTAMMLWKAFNQEHGNIDYGLNAELNPYSPVFLSPTQHVAEVMEWMSYWFLLG